MLYWNENIPIATSILPECAVAILLRKVSVAAVSSFAFNAAKLSTNLSFYLLSFLNKMKWSLHSWWRGISQKKRSYVCFVIILHLTSWKVGLAKSGTVNVRTTRKYKNHVENAYLIFIQGCNFQKCQKISTKMLK